MTFDPEKPVKTRDGKMATIIKRDLRGDRQIVAVIDAPNGAQFVMTYDANGNRSIFQDDDLDLVNTPEKTLLWGNVYPGSVVTHETYFDANANAKAGRIGLISMTIEDRRLVAVENHDTTGSGK